MGNVKRKLPIRIATEKIMTEGIEKFNPDQMEILSEFPVEYDNDEEITVPQNAEKSHVLLGTLGENIVIAYRSKKSNRIITDVVFEKESILSVGKSINGILREGELWTQPVEYEKGKDKVLVTYSSSFGHTITAPLERVNVYNRRDYELDGLRAQDMWLSLPPRMAKKLAGEIEKIFRQ